jgi:chaperone modulatory protein CbpM
MNLSRQEFLVLAGVDHDALEGWLEEQWLMPRVSAEELCFSDIDLARARFIRELTVGLGVNCEGVGVILKLVDQLHGIRFAMAEMREALRTDPERP